MVTDVGKKGFLRYTPIYVDATPETICPSFAICTIFRTAQETKREIRALS